MATSARSAAGSAVDSVPMGTAPEQREDVPDAPLARAEELFLGALERPAECRSEWIAGQPAADADRAWAARMLAAFESAAGRVDSGCSK